MGDLTDKFGGAVDAVKGAWNRAFGPSISDFNNSVDLGVRMNGKQAFYGANEGRHGKLDSEILYMDADRAKVECADNGKCIGLKSLEQQVRKGLKPEVIQDQYGLFRQLQGKAEQLDPGIQKDTLDGINLTRPGASDAEMLRSGITGALTTLGYVAHEKGGFSKAGIDPALIRKGQDAEASLSRTVEWANVRDDLMNKVKSDPQLQQVQRQIFDQMQAETSQAPLQQRAPVPGQKHAF